MNFFHTNCPFFILIFLICFFLLQLKINLREVKLAEEVDLKFIARYKRRH